ncbi:MAG: glycosyltransferase family 9 protein [Acidobacteria bacterium]|nr:glycosyltransferase family 9 protein [Acidobacteriota bacterium]
MPAGPTLLVDTSFLGDVLCAEPLVRAAAGQWPDSPVDFLTSPGGAEVLEGHPGIRRLMVFEKRGVDRGLGGLLRRAATLRTEDYARAICSHRSWRTALLLRLSRIPERIGFHNASGAWLYSKRVRHQPELPEVAKNLELVGGGAWERPRMYPSEDERERARELTPADSFVALAPGSIWFTKRWPAQRFAEVTAGILRQGLSCVLLGGSEDQALGEEVGQLAELNAEERSRLHNLCGATNLRESFVLLEQARALVTNDSAPMHLGVAAGIPVIAVYCSTLPAFGFAPQGRDDVVLEVEGLPCRPCGIHGRRACPEIHFRCAWDTSAEKVLAALQARLRA